MSGLNYLFVGAENAESFFIGSQECELIYLGNEIVYQKGDFSGLVMKGKVTMGKESGSTYDLKIKSSEPWTLSVDTAVTWLEFSQLTGGTGETIVTITTTEENQTGSDRSTTITATTANYSATCVVKQISVHYVEFIHRTTLSSDVNNAYIDTLITPTTATTFRVVGMGKGNGQGNTIVGYQDNDSKDYRLFWHGTNGGTLCFDFNNERLQNSSWGGASNGRLIDITCNNYSVTSGDSQTPMMTGTTQSSIQDPHTIKIDVGTWWFKSLQIWEGQTLVFDGQAAVDDANNIIGLYDSVSNTWKYNPNVSMAYEIDNLPISWSSSGNTTQADYEVDSHLYQDFHFCTLRLKETIGTSICYYYYRVYITTDHKVEVRQYSSTAILLYLSLGYGESGELRSGEARNCFISHNSSGNGTFANVTFECNDYQLNGMDYHWDFSYQA